MLYIVKMSKITCHIRMTTRYEQQSTTPLFWEDATKYLCSCDPVLAKIIHSMGDKKLQKSGDPFRALISSIVGQQISVKAANAIFSRVATLVNDIFTPYSILEADPELLRACGLSGQKVKYVSNIAHYFINNSVNDSFWEQDFESVILPSLVSIKGVGPWTAQMLGIFYLHEPDILPLLDIGLLRGVQKNYPELFNDTTKDDPKKLKKVQETTQKLAENWRPYCSVATWYLWASIDGEIVQY